MFEKTEIRRQKTKVLVRLCLTTGQTVEGDLFLQNGQRIQDLLNDERAFLPIEEGESKVTMVAKTTVSSATTLGEAVPVDGDPYKILRIEPRATDQEVRQAWMKRLKSAHPDRLAALELDYEILAAARRASQRINAAYDQIVKERRSAA